jgi:hypothetical protein
MQECRRTVKELMHTNGSDLSSRRTFVRGIVGSALMVALAQRLAHAQAVRGSLKTFVSPWVAGMEDACAAVSSGQLSPLQWQAEIATMLAKVERTDLLKAIDFDALAARAPFPDQGEGLTRLYFPDADGRRQALSFTAYLFALKKDVAVVPHGHHNMVTMHMMLAGRAHARHFDRVHDSATHLVIRPTSDAVIEPGHVSSISDDQDNIHWFQALTQPVFMFNIGVYRVDPSRPSGDRDYVDPLRGEKLGGGLLRAARLDRQAAYAAYGRVA